MNLFINDLKKIFIKIEIADLDTFLIFNLFHFQNQVKSLKFKIFYPFFIGSSTGGAGDDCHEFS